MSMIRSEPIARQSQDSEPSKALDEENIAALFSEIRPEIKRFIDRYIDTRIRSRVDASDIVQSTFIDANTRMERFLTEQPMPAKQWLFYLAKMKALETNHHHLGVKKRAATQEKDLSVTGRAFSDQSSPSQAMSKEESHRRLAGAIEQLPYRYRLVIELRNFRSCSNQEAARQLEISEKAASKLYCRALEKLRGVLDHEV